MLEHEHDVAASELCQRCLFREHPAGGWGQQRLTKTDKDWTACFVHILLWRWLHLTCWSCSQLDLCHLLHPQIGVSAIPLAMAPALHCLTACAVLGIVRSGLLEGLPI